MNGRWNPTWAVSGRALVFIWLPVLAVTVAHFGTPMEHEWLHDVLRRLYYIPIIVGAFLFGLRGALLTSFVVTVLYLPHAFWMTGPHAHHHGMIHADPTGTANKILELVLYNVVALVTGLLVEKEQRARRDLEQKIVEMQAIEQQLVRAGRLQALGEMTAGLAHEIKNPLASLKASSAIIADEIPETSPRRKMVVILQKEIDRLAALLERFLAFARPGRLTLAEVSLSHAVEQAVALVKPQADVRHVALRVDMQGLGLTIQGGPIHSGIGPGRGAGAGTGVAPRQVRRGRHPGRGPRNSRVRSGAHLRSLLFHSRQWNRARTLHCQPFDRRAPRLHRGEEPTRRRD
jgi:signal transduction histidine kinase